MIVVQKKMFGYDIQHNRIGELIFSTEQPSGVSDAYKFLTLKITYNSTYYTFAYLLFDDIKKALEICNEFPRDTTLRIEVPHYAVTISSNGVRTEVIGSLIIEHKDKEGGTQVLFTKGETSIIFFIEVEKFYNLIKLLEKFWEPSDKNKN